MGLKLKQGDVNVAFLHADIGKDEKVYVVIPIEIEKYSDNIPKKCLKLLKNIYGLRQIPYDFWQYMTKNWRRVAFRSPNSVHVSLQEIIFMCIIYVGDLMFW